LGQPAQAKLPHAALFFQNSKHRLDQLLSPPIHRSSRHAAQFSSHPLLRRMTGGGRPYQAYEWRYEARYEAMNI